MHFHNMLHRLFRGMFLVINSPVHIPVAFSSNPLTQVFPLPGRLARATAALCSPPLINLQPTPGDSVTKGGLLLLPFSRQ